MPYVVYDRLLVQRSPAISFAVVTSTVGVHLLEERRNRVFKALHEPLLIWGIERKIFGGVLLAAYTIHLTTDSMMAALVVLVVGIIFGRIVTAKDPIYFTVMLQSYKFKTIYDGAKYEAPHVEIR
jgi:type IV secretory pathway VirB3-like protein